MKVERLEHQPENMYRVRRTSIWDYEKQPCEGAVCFEIPRLDTRCCDDPKKVPAHHGTEDWWYNEGTNHQIVDGKIVRQMGFIHRWFVVVDNLVEFIRKHEPVVMSLDENGRIDIEIYDDYRE